MPPSPYRKIGCDLDGVLADFTYGFVGAVHELWPGRLALDYYPNDWDWTNSGLSGEEIRRVWERIQQRENFWLLLPAHTGNVQALAAYLRLHPYDEIFYLTSRISTAGAPTFLQSAMWLQNLGLLPVGAKVLVKPEGIHKHSIYKRLGVGASLDDCLLHVRMALLDSTTHRAVLLERPWNAGVSTSVPCVKSVAEFLLRLPEFLREE